MFEGECVVAEGFNDSNSRFNVNRIHKPLAQKPHNKFSRAFLGQCHELQKGKALHVMVAAGPYTTPDGLLYEPLKDLIELVKRDQPHCLVLMGPFLDAKNKDLQDGDVCFRRPNDN